MGPRLSFAPVVQSSAAAPRNDVYGRSLVTTTDRRTAPRIDSEKLVDLRSQDLPSGGGFVVQAGVGEAEANDLRKLARPRRRRRIGRGIVLFASGFVIAGAFYLMQSATRAMYGAVGIMPVALHAPTRSLVDFVVYQTAPVHDGLRWIDVGDPRLRKADRSKP